MAMNKIRTQQRFVIGSKQGARNMAPNIFAHQLPTISPQRETLL
jgi:hypothetical protein